MEESKQEHWDGFNDFDPAHRFPRGLPGFLRRSRVGSRFPLASPNL
jgi:hypothetical protein